MADHSPFDDRALLPPRQPRRWRYAKYAMAVVLPVGAILAAHRITEPEGLDAAESPANASAINYVKASDSVTPAREKVARPPARSFASGAFGHSSAVRVRVALPNAELRLPL
jgi:hypothetical protein